LSPKKENGCRQDKGILVSTKPLASKLGSISTHSPNSVCSLVYHIFLCLLGWEGSWKFENRKGEVDGKGDSYLPFKIICLVD